MPHIKVLVVEDKELHFSKIELLLEEIGWHVCGHATSGDEALRLVKAVSPDIILMDIKIDGEKSGIDVAEKLKEDDIPIIFTTSFKDDKTVERAISTGPYAYLTKPINKTELQAAISIALFKSDSPEPSNNEILIKESIFVKQVDEIVKISFEDVLWIGSAEEEKYLQIQLTDNSLRVRSSLSQMMEKLPKNFVRINSSTVINLKRIERIQDKLNLITVGEFELSISRRFKKGLMDKLSFLN
ncbi:LytR/AlgR family response regulator transcription factor [Ekhidna sp.]|uniref:LytR/AlgR family response regulator transcription factor n=1 Tax=Ekhidna sp. TaxID=2608089 RepID=UPI003CCB8CA6